MSPTRAAIASFAAISLTTVARAVQAPPPPPAPEPPPNAPVSPASPAPGETQAPPAPSAAPAVASPETSPKPRRVYVIEDRYTEFHGILRAEEDGLVVLEQVGGRLKTFHRSRVLDVIELVDPEPGQPGVVTMRDGRTYSGVILADRYEGVDIEIEGITQRLPRSDVHHVSLTLTPRQFYEQARKSIGPDQYTDRMRLARYLFNKKMYVEAREELVSLLELIELHEAKELLRTVEAQLALGAEAPESLGNPEWLPPPDVLRDPDGTSGRSTMRDTLPDRFLTDEDVNLIRVYEIDFQNPPRVSVTPELIRAVIERYADSDLIPSDAAARTALFRVEPIRFVRLMFDLKARELYPEIKVAGEPHSLNLFRQRVHNTWLIGNCATSRCHGGVDAGRFFLHNRNHKDENVRYTNLLILERLRIEGLPPLVDWDKPLDSLIIQYGLPRNEAKHPHPDVKGWKPVFTAISKRMLDDFVAWTRAMYQPRPDYPVDFEPPQLDSPDAASNDPRVPR